MIVTDLTFPHETVKMIGPPAHAFQLDVTQEEDWRSLSVKSRDVGEVDIVVNNAGYFPIVLSTIWICRHGERRWQRIWTRTF